MGLSSTWKGFKNLLKPVDKSGLQEEIAKSLKKSGEKLEAVNQSISDLKSAFKDRCGRVNIANMFLDEQSDIEKEIDELQKKYKAVRSILSDGLVDRVGKTGKSESKKCADAFIQTLSALEETLAAFKGQILTAGGDNSDVLVAPWKDTMKEIVKLNSAVEKVSDKKAALGGDAKVEAKALTKTLRSQVEDLKDIFVSVNEAVTAGKATMGTIEGKLGPADGDLAKFDIFSPGSEKLLAKSVNSLAPVQLETSIDDWLKKPNAAGVGIAAVAADVKDRPLQILHSVKKLLAAILESGQLSLLSKSHLKNYVKKLGDVLAMQHAVLLKIAKDGNATNCSSQIKKLDKLNIELKKLDAKLGSKVKSLRDAKIIIRLADKSAQLLSKVVTAAQSQAGRTSDDILTSFENGGRLDRSKSLPHLRNLGSMHRSTTRPGKGSGSKEQQYPQNPQGSPTEQITRFVGSDGLIPKKEQVGESDHVDHAPDSETAPEEVKGRQFDESGSASLRPGGGLDYASPNDPDYLSDQYVFGNRSQTLDSHPRGDGSLDREQNLNDQESDEYYSDDNGYTETPGSKQKKK